MVARFDYSMSSVFTHHKTCRCMRTYIHTYIYIITPVLFSSCFFTCQEREFSPKNVQDFMELKSLVL